MSEMAGKRLASRRVTAIALLGCVALFAAACLPAAPATGRPGPVRKVLVLGDSVTYGLFGTTPQVHRPLGRMLADRGVSLHVTGFAGESPIDTYPGHFSWVLRMQHEISTWDPDMVVVQSTLFAGPWSKQRQEAYRVAMRQILTLARSRDAHVYLVSHHRAPNRTDADARDLAQQLQAEVAKEFGGVATIPLDWWMGRCSDGTVGDGWHLSAKGQNCHALAIVFAVDQLRSAVG